MAAVVAVVWIAVGGGAISEPPSRNSNALPSRLAPLDTRISGQLESDLVREIDRLFAARADSSAAGLESVWTMLADAGYLDARLCHEVDSVAIITPGSRIDRIRLRWRAARDSLGFARVADRMPREARSGGGPLSAALSASIARALEVCADAGCPLTAIALAAYSAPPEPALCFDVTMGPPVAVAGVRFFGASSTRDSYLRRVARFDGRETYRQARWLQARDALLRTGLFDDVSRPALVVADTARSRPGAGEPVSAEVVFRLRERQVNVARGVIGYSGERSTLAGYVDLALGNLFGTGRSARLLWRRDGDARGRFEIDWHEPFLWTLPLGLDLRLEHEVDDTLYADTRWGAELLWSPSPNWTASFGWQRQRLTSTDVAGTIRRSTLLVGARREIADASARRSGWEFRADLGGMQGDLPEMLSLSGRAREWAGGRRWGFASEQAFGFLSNGERTLRSDAFRVGGANSLRGLDEGRYRALRYGVQRFEWGPSFGGGPPRVYLLVDLGWLEQWRPLAENPVYGSGGGRPFLWSGGVGLRLPTRSGVMHLDYAIPKGETLGHGRLHLGIESRF